MDYLKQLQQLQQGGGEANARTSAESIRSQLEDRRVGCGCLGWMLALLVGVYWLASSWLEAPGLAMSSVVVTGAVLILAVPQRGYHLVTGAAWLGLALVGVGGTSGLYMALWPAEAVGVLPKLLQVPYGWGVIGGAGLALFAGMSWKMKGQISTAESMYAIQLQAASSRSVPAQEAPRLENALEVLELSTTAGLFPLGADFLSMDDWQTPPVGSPGPHLFPLLAIHIHPAPDPWTHALGEGAALRLPEALLAGPSPMAPRSVGVLYTDGVSLRYAPLRKEQGTVAVEIASIQQMKVRINGIAVKTGDTAEEEWDFAVPHAWRLGALLAFLRTFEVEVAGEGASLVAVKVRDGARRPLRVPGKAELREARAALEALGAGAAPESARAQAAAELEGLLSGRYLPLRSMGVALTQAWALVQKGEDPVEVEVALDEVESLVSGLPEALVSEEVAWLIDELHALRFLRFERWSDLLELVADMPAPRLDEDAEEDEEAEEARSDAWREALVEAVKAARSGKAEVLASSLASARQQGDALIIEALAAR